MALRSADRVFYTCTDQPAQLAALRPEAATAMPLVYAPTERSTNEPADILAFVAQFEREADLLVGFIGRFADVLEQILGNLLSNVEKYASSSGVVEIATAVEGDEAIITVADEGPGVPNSLREKIFEPFFRASDSLSEGVSGAGIGLAIALELALAHGGNLALEPSSSGARFRLTLRAPAAEEPQA